VNRSSDRCARIRAHRRFSFGFGHPTDTASRELLDGRIQARQRFVVASNRASERAQIVVKTPDRRCERGSALKPGETRGTLAAGETDRYDTDHAVGSGDTEKGNEN
jgi:hypothetical protein